MDVKQAILEIKARVTERKTHDHHMDNDLPVFDDWCAAEDDIEELLWRLEAAVSKDSEER